MAVPRSALLLAWAVICISALFAQASREGDELFALLHSQENNAQEVFQGSEFVEYLASDEATELRALLGKRLSHARVEEFAFALQDKGVVDFINDVGNTLEGAANTVGDGFVDTANTVGNGIVDTANTIGNAITATAQDIWRDTKKAASETERIAKIVGSKCEQLAVSVGKDVVDFAEKAGRAVLDALKEALRFMCEFPGAKTAVKEIIQFLIDQIVCVGLTSVGLLAPFCYPLPLKYKVLKITMTTAGKAALKCSIYSGLRKATTTCDGLNDYFSDLIKDVVGTIGTLGFVSPFALVSNTIVECMCGGCPGTCAYSNRAVCAHANQAVGWASMKG